MPRTVTAGRLAGFLLRDGISEARIREIAVGKEEWTALDVLRLDGVPAADRLWAVLREDFIDAPALHEFACRCAEQALAALPEGKRDPRCESAIAAKRAWLRGGTDDAGMKAARDAARIAAEAAWYTTGPSGAEEAAAKAAACAALPGAAWAARKAAAWSAEVATCYAHEDAYEAIWESARKAQISMLAGMLEAGTSDGGQPAGGAPEGGTP